jgi:hypothetical protein
MGPMLRALQGAERHYFRRRGTSATGRWKEPGARKDDSIAASPSPSARDDRNFFLRQSACLSGTFG